MRYISYRSKLRLRATLIGMLIVLLTLAALAAGIFIYLERYIVYTPEGARLVFEDGGGTLLETEFDVEGLSLVPGARLAEAEEPNEVQSITRLEGWYIDSEALADPAAIRSALSNLESPKALLMDVRSIYGNFYYPTAMEGAETSSLVDPEAVGALIHELAGNGKIYLIARLPAFRDSAFALANQSCGLSLSGGALWMDSDGAYWLNPADDQVIAHIEDAIRELSGLGFDEVVLDDFYFPQSGSILYHEDRGGAVLEAARRLQANMAKAHVKLSIASRDSALAPYAARIYIQENDGAQVPSLASAFAEADTPLSERLVFLTDSRDTRFQEYGCLKPLLNTQE